MTGMKINTESACSEIAIEMGPLLLDKLSITFDAPPAVRRSIRQAIKTHPRIRQFESKNYRYSAKLAISDALLYGPVSTSTLVIQTGPVQGASRLCRLEWNPAKVDMRS